MRPYAFWDPAATAADWVPPGAGPLVVGATDLARWTRMVASATGLYLVDDSVVGYQRDAGATAGTGLLAGWRVRASQYCPAGLTWVGSAPPWGEPLPLDQVDYLPAPWGFSPRWIGLGWRLPLRGVLGAAPTTGGAASLTCTWADAAGARSSGAPTGGYTGATLRTRVSLPGYLPARHHAWALLHGKRPHDVDWSYHPVADHLLGAHAGALTIANGLDHDQLRCTISGGSPCTILLSRWDGAVWTPLYTEAVDLTASIPSVDDWPLRLQIGADLVAGATLPQPPTPLTWPTAETWFPTLILDQFEPWVGDDAVWTEREWEDYWSWLVPPSPPRVTYERRRPPIDLTHLPPALLGGPAALRQTDDTLGVGVGLGPCTVLTARAPWDSTGWAPTALRSPCVCAEEQFGYRAPFALVGQFRLAVGAWTPTVPVDLLLAGSLWAPDPAVAGGMGLYWRYTGPTPGQGELVAAAWDDVLGDWATAVAPFYATAWDQVPVTLALAWSGQRGYTVGRPNFELRIVANGRTLAAVVIPAMRLRGVQTVTVGSDRAIVDGSRASAAGFLRRAALFGAACSDDDLRRVWGDAPPLENATFALADVRPGDAVAWTLASYQLLGGWAEFNQVRTDLLAWRRCQEYLAAGWRAEAYRWTYTTAADRTAAGGFVAADVGSWAWQQEDDTAWQLTAHDPITWTALLLGGNQRWADRPPQRVGTFHATAGAYAGPQEQFALWEFPALGVGARPPWADPSPWVPPCSDTVGPGAGPTGFTGWYAAVHGSGLQPLTVERFAEAWSNDPFSTAGAWTAGKTYNGRCYAAAGAWPRTIPPDAHWLWIWGDASVLVGLDLPPGTYATATALASTLAGLWAAAAGDGTGCTFGAWTAADGLTGVWFGWSGTGLSSGAWAFCRWDDNDARAACGFCAGRGLDLPAAVITTRPGTCPATAHLLLDQHSLLLFDVRTDPAYAGPFAVEDGRALACFGAVEVPPDPRCVESFSLIGWVGPAAAWTTAYGVGDLTAALFDGGTTNQECFNDATWPEELFPA